MEREDQRRADALDRFWDAVQRGQATRRPPAVDDVTEAVIILLNQGRASPPRTTHERIRQQITTQARTLEFTWSPHAHSEATVTPSGTRSSSWTTHAAPVRGPGVQFTTALLVLTALTIGYLTLRPAHPPPDRPLSLSAIQGPATATPADGTNGRETLAAVALPAGEVPSDIIGGLNHYTIPPGTSSTWEPSSAGATCCTGPRLDYVLSGNLAIRNDAQTQVQRAGTQTWEAIPSGTEIVLRPGDALLSRMEDVFTAANRGAAPVELLDGVFFSGDVAIDPIPDGWLFQSSRDQDIIFDTRQVPAAPMAMRLQRATLAPEAHFPVPANAIAQLLVSLDARASLAILPNPDPHDAQNPGARYVKKHGGTEPVPVYVLTLEPGIPANNPGPATSNAGATQEAVLETTLPAAMIPTSGNVDFIGWSASLDPGATTDAAPGCCSGPQILHVLAGELTLSVDGPLQVIRSTGIGAASHTVPDGTDVILKPGDSAVFDYALTAKYANDTASAVHVVGGSLTAGWVRGAPAGLTLIDYNDEYPVSALPPGPVNVTLTRVSLPPGGTTSPPPPGVIVTDVGGYVDVDISMGADGSLRNIGPSEATFFILSLAPGGGTRDAIATSPTP